LTADPIKLPEQQKFVKPEAFQYT